MARELNRELFGSSGRVEAEPQATNQGSMAYARAEEVKRLHLHLENLSKRLKEFESRLEVMTSKTDDMLGQNRQRFERVQGHFQRHTEMIQKGFADVNSKIAQVVSRVNERKVEDGIVKEMIERHAHVVQSFEARMQQLQRLISEQELQLINARSELKAAIQEIARLKKL